MLILFFKKIIMYTKNNENHQNWRFFFFNPVFSEITRFRPSLQVSSKKPGFSQSYNFCDFAKWCLIFVQPFKIMMHSICIAHSCAPCNTPSFLAFSRSRIRLQPNAGAWPPKCVQAHGESPAAVPPFSQGETSFQYNLQKPVPHTQAVKWLNNVLPSIP